MIAIEEMRQRLLSELEDAGEQNLLPLLNTVMDPSCYDQALDPFRVSLERLIKEGLLLFAVRRELGKKIELVSLDESLAMLAGSFNTFRYNEDELQWEGEYDDDQYVLLTDVGKELGFKILDKRGYQWW